MAIEDYKVTKEDERDIPNGKKIKLALRLEETGEKLVEEWLGLSKRQVTDGKLESRIRQWGEKAAESYEASKEDEDSVEEVSL